MTATLTPQQQARQEQSSRASTEIGARLLKGWTMLSDECQNSTCYGIPLMRAPKPKAPSKGEESDLAFGAPTSQDAVAGTAKRGRGSKVATLPVDVRKQCVICDRIYVNASDVEKHEAWAAHFQPPTTASAPAKSVLACMYTCQVNLLRAERRGQPHRKQKKTALASVLVSHSCVSSFSVDSMVLISVCSLALLPCQTLCRHSHSVADQVIRHQSDRA